VNNYKQALSILDSRPALEKSMKNLGVETEAAFEGWLEEEYAYLSGLLKEPLEETLQMEYYQKLVSLEDSEYVFRPSPC
jgi:hypothetical protein